jgi:hypothetical protein
MSESGTAGSPPFVGHSLSDTDSLEQAFNRLKEPPVSTDESTEAQALAQRLPSVLTDFGVDKDFVLALTRILAPRGKSEVLWNDWSHFFEVLSTGNALDFQKMIFSAICPKDRDYVTADDLVEFGMLIHDPISGVDAQAIISKCGSTSGTMSFTEFSDWYKAEHGIKFDLVENTPQSGESK